MHHGEENFACRNIEDKKMSPMFGNHHINTVTKRWGEKSWLTQREHWLLFDKTKLFPFSMQETLAISIHSSVNYNPDINPSAWMLTMSCLQKSLKCLNRGLFCKKSISLTNVSHGKFLPFSLKWFSVLRQEKKSLSRFLVNKTKLL